jgi:hypothetical protein
VTLYDARLGQTVIAGWRIPGRGTHAVLYGNEPENLVAVPNAMILHIPLQRGKVLTQDNFLPTAGLRHVLEDMWAAAPKRQQREVRGLSFGVASRGSISVFDMGSYTWVAATHADADEIITALEMVHPDRRPHLSAGLIRFYRQTWPDDALAIGCFSRAGGGSTEPVGVEYPPQEFRVLRYPAVDAHGHIPAWGEPVFVDHRIIVGTDEFGVGGRVRYREEARMDDRLAGIVPRLVVGAELTRIPMIQGDFYVDFGQDWSPGAGSADLMRASGPELDGRAKSVPMVLA